MKISKIVSGGQTGVDQGIGMKYDEVLYTEILGAGP